MYEIISVYGKSVRVRYGLIAFDVCVFENQDKKYIRLPKGMYIDKFSVLVGIVLEAYENSKLQEIVEYDVKERSSISIS